MPVDFFNRPRFAERSIIIDYRLAYREIALDIPSAVRLVFNVAKQQCEALFKMLIVPPLQTT